MVLAGIERFLIEKIRINPVLNVFGMHATQAEIIAFFLILFGIIGVATLGRRLPGGQPLTAKLSGS